jgi:putative DNA primase/helicase
MNVEYVIRVLGGHRSGSTLMVRCPAHQDQNPSLSIRKKDGRILVHCHAGCDQVQVITALRELGLWEDDDHNCKQLRPSASSGPDRLDGERTMAALNIWRFTKPGNGTLVETYLQSRGLIIPLPRILRFHAGLKHPSGDKWPAMVAPVTRGNHHAPVAIHRTFLTFDGTGKAPAAPQKMMFGPCRGGAVRLAPLSEALMVGEGIETCLAAMQATGIAAWAALSASGLRSLDLPHEVRDVIVLADGDDSGEAAAQNCGHRWKREGRRVRIARAPHGLDFNDLLLKREVCDPRVGGVSGVGQRLVSQAIAEAEEIRVEGRFEPARRPRENWNLEPGRRRSSSGVGLILHKAGGTRARCREWGRLHNFEPPVPASVICTPCLKSIVVGAITHDGGQRPKWA